MRCRAPDRSRHVGCVAAIGAARIIRAAYRPATYLRSCRGSGESPGRSAGRAVRGLSARCNGAARGGSGMMSTQHGGLDNQDRPMRHMTSPHRRVPMNRSRLFRIAGSVLALGLFTATLTGSTPVARADGSGPVITPNTPTTVGPFVPKPDLVVDFDNLSCAKYEDGIHILIKVRVLNTANTPATSDFLTRVTVDGVEAPGSPHLTVAPLWVSQVFHINVKATSGW